MLEHCNDRTNNDRKKFNSIFSLRKKFEKRQINYHAYSFKF